MIGSFSLGDAVVLGGLVCITSTLVCDVSLWEDVYGVVLCLKVSENLLIACIFSVPMDANGNAGAGLDFASIRSSATLVSAS